MKKSLILLLFLCLKLVILKSENDFENNKPKTIFEPFFNVSNALIKFTGNQNNQSVILESPFLIGAKFRINSKNAIRFGTDFNFTKNTENLGSIARTSSISYYNFTLGYERRYRISKSFDLYYGLDFRYFYEENLTIVFDQQSSGNNVISTLVDVNNGPGAALHTGFVWNITPRISVFTEASVSGFYFNNNRYLIKDGFKEVYEDKIIQRIVPYAPNSIFFLIKI